MRPRNLKRLEVAAALSLAAISVLAFGGSQKHSYGPVRSERRTLENFDRIGAGQLFQLVVHLGQKPAIVLHAPAELLPHIKTSIRNGSLEIKLDDERAVRSDAKISADISVPTLAGATVSGMASMDVKGLVRQTSFSAAASGLGTINLSADVSRISIAQSGKSTVSIGSLKTKAFQLAGTGAGTCRLSGSADSTNIAVAGDFQFLGGRFTTDRASIQSDGACNTEIRVKKTLNAQASGASQIHFIGKPQVTKNISGMARITG